MISVCQLVNLKLAVHSNSYLKSHHTWKEKDLQYNYLLVEECEVMKSHD